MIEGGRDRGKERSTRNLIPSEGNYGLYTDTVLTERLVLYPRHLMHGRSVLGQAAFCGQWDLDFHLTKELGCGDTLMKKGSRGSQSIPPPFDSPMCERRPKDEHAIPCRAPARPGSSRMQVFLKCHPFSLKQKEIKKLHSRGRPAIGEAIRQRTRARESICGADRTGSHHQLAHYAWLSNGAQFSGELTLPGQLWIYNLCRGSHTTSPNVG